MKPRILLRSIKCDGQTSVFTGEFSHLVRFAWRDEDGDCQSDKMSVHCCEDALEAVCYALSHFFPEEMLPQKVWDFVEKKFFRA